MIWRWQPGAVLHTADVGSTPTIATEKMRYIEVPFDVAYFDLYLTQRMRVRIPPSPGDVAQVVELD